MSTAEYWMFWPAGWKELRSSGLEFSRYVLLMYHGVAIEVVHGTSTSSRELHTMSSRYQVN